MFKISIFVQNFNFCSKSQFLIQNFHFCCEFPFLVQNFHFLLKFTFLFEIRFSFKIFESISVFKSVIMRIPPTIKLRIKSLVRPKIEIMNDQRNINIRKLRQMQMLYLTSGAVEGESVYQTIRRTEDTTLQTMMILDKKENESYLRITLFKYTMK